MTGLCLVFFAAASCDEAQGRSGQKDDLLSSQLIPRHQHLERILKPIQYTVMFLLLVLAVVKLRICCCY